MTKLCAHASSRNASLSYHLSRSSELMKFTTKFFAFLVWTSVVGTALRASAVEGPQYISTQQQSGALAIAEHGKVLPICVTADDFPGVRRAAGDFAKDLERVTGTKAELGCDLSSSSK